MTLKPGDHNVVLRLNVYEDRIVEPLLFFDGAGRLEFDRIEIRLLQTEAKLKKTSRVPVTVLPLLL